MKLLSLIMETVPVESIALRGDAAEIANTAVGRSLRQIERNER